ncbi:MAG TPA: LptE family protein [Tenuifilaceae bacterium]|nr:LptE family protein [Tenuifilaceae bacterium]HPE17734.1 LptE family protein [Tenuifilaceae bacterium]HPJ46441.1 LptE family protein [Tenuifilaceae bacterium]HPQ34976.1 LptE family protein [Tenuifilaceae bacterium]HRX68680.1 LptE family protein [Tenuifilaceae bacterium]
MKKKYMRANAVAKIALLGFLTVLAPGCKVKYSFTGASISPDVKTFSVSYFQNLAPLVNPSLSSNLTEELKNKFITQTQLSPVDDGGDLSFSGEIRGYSVSPVAIQQGEVAAYNRLTISVRVKFENSIDPTQNYDKTFTHYEEFPSDKQLNNVESELVRLIVEKLVEDIFNNAVANW